MGEILRLIENLLNFFRAIFCIFWKYFGPIFDRKFLSPDFSFDRISNIAESFFRSERDCFKFACECVCVAWVEPWLAWVGSNFMAPKGLNLIYQRAIKFQRKIGDSATTLTFHRRGDGTLQEEVELLLTLNFELSLTAQMGPLISNSQTPAPVYFVTL